ncbi:MAG: DUF302 domain-containing protein [Hyphomonadaceae bacterium]|jgi:uncharacterized protein (DUF302 family)|nr:DUF302 domain-containing protein [Hyphomonadaceae bacterium]
MRTSTFAAAVLALAASASAGGAQEVRIYAKAAPYEDVKLDLTSAIASRGLVVDANGQVGKMLDRTGPDVGSTRQVYTHAEYFSFCSAKYSRRMMEADPVNIGFCPFVIFMYEAPDAPGRTTVGYRRPTPQGNEASRQVLTEIDALLDGIVKEAVQ